MSFPSITGDSAASTIGGNLNNLVESGDARTDRAANTADVQESSEQAMSAATDAGIEDRTQQDLENNRRQQAFYKYKQDQQFLQSLWQ